MGKFTQKVRHNQIPGPNKIKFNREEWKSLLSSLDADEEDKRLAVAGLFFDDLLIHLRSEKKLAELPIKPSAIKRILIAIATWNLWNIYNNTESIKPKDRKRNVFVAPSVMQLTVTTHDGQSYAPDELITGLGDGLKHIIRELHFDTDSNEQLNEYEINTDHLKAINIELNYAITYQSAVEHWNECVGNNYGLSKHKDGILHASFSKDLEIARIASTYRRLNTALQDTMFILEEWFNVWTRPIKEKLCEIPLVSKINGTESLGRIELGLNKKVLDKASASVAAKLWLNYGYYEKLLDEQLPDLSNFTLNQIINGWRLLQSLASSIFDGLGAFDENNIRSILQFAPNVPKNILHATFAKAFNLEHSHAEKLVDVFVYRGENSQEIWTRPLISCNENYCLVVPCIHSVHLHRIVEGWMRQGGLDLDRRGPEFEQFCKDALQIYLKDSPIKDSVTILNPSLKFKPPSERGEELDLVVIVADTVLLIEAKCILWPDESLQFANYRDTIEKAVNQILRKRDSIVRNYESFSSRLKQLGHTSPETPNIICCVLTNSAVFSGFPIEGVPIVDLKILGKFFENEHVLYEERQKGKCIRRQAIKFYTDKTDAGKVLEKYLLAPPQLLDAKKSIKTRQIVFPIKSKSLGNLIHETYRVEMDIEQLLSDYETPQNGDDVGPAKHVEDHLGASTSTNPDK